MITNLLFIGRPTPYKGFDVLVQSLLSIDNISWKLTVIGKHNNIFNNENFIFVGSKTNTEVATFIRQADIVIVPSLYETFGNVALEAMSCAKPVIASNTGGLSDLIEDKINGLLVKPNDIFDLRKKVQYLLKNPIACKNMGKNGFIKSKDYYWKHIGHKTNQLLKTLI